MISKTEKMVGLFVLMCVLSNVRAQVPISALPPGAALTGTEDVPVVQSLTTVRTTPAAVNTYVRSLAGTFDGVQTFNGRTLFAFPTSGSTTSVAILSTAPTLELANTQAPANNRRATQYIDNAGTHRWAVCQDNTTCNDYLQVLRQGSSVNGFRILTNNSNERLRIDENGAWILAGATAGTAGQVFTSNGASAAPTWQTPPTAASGTYTPTITNIGNMTNPQSSFPAIWSRVGNVVTVSGPVQVTTTCLDCNAQFRLNLPVASTLSAPTDLAGQASALTATSGSSGTVGVVFAQVANNAASFDIRSPLNTTYTFYYTYQYTVQ